MAGTQSGSETGQRDLSQSRQASTTVLRPHTKDKEQEGGKKDKKLTCVPKHEPQNLKNKKIN